MGGDSAAAAAAATRGEDASSSSSLLPPPQGERHVLEAETELRLEIPHSSLSSGSSAVGAGGASCTIRLVKGSCELWGVELALNQNYDLMGGTKLALFTWHGCVVDVDFAANENNNCFAYTSEETNANVAYVNTHAQLEALRDEALASLSTSEGPRVLVVGPPESGKSSLTRVLIAYAVKLGRTPLWVDLDPADNALSVPGTLAVTPMTTASAISVETFGSSCGSISSVPGIATPLVLWYGSLGLEQNVDLFKAQVSALGRKIDKRLENDVEARASGIIVNTNGWIQDDGYQMLLHSVKALRISVVLIMGHDRLYSMFTSHFSKPQPDSDTATPPAAAASPPKIIKLPRSGGVVSRDATFRRQSRSLAMKRYFYGDMVSIASTAGSSSTATTTTTTTTRVPRLTPFLLHVSFADVTIYRTLSVALSASLLPVAAKQSTDLIQLESVTITQQNLQHKLLAVCHPGAVEAYNESGRPSDLYESGVAGFVVVEKVLMDTDMLHLLSPCAGSLPSHTLIVGDLTWME